MFLLFLSPPNFFLPFFLSFSLSHNTYIHTQTSFLLLYVLILVSRVYFFFLFPLSLSPFLTHSLSPSLSIYLTHSLSLFASFSHTHIFLENVRRIFFCRKGKKKEHRHVVSFSVSWWRRRALVMVSEDCLHLLKIP